MNSTTTTPWLLADSREARAQRARLEMQDRVYNQVAEERARTVLSDAGHEERANGREGFRFRTDHMGVFLAAEYANGDMWHGRLDVYEELFKMAGWYVERERGTQGSYLRLYAAYTVRLECMQEGMRRVVADAYSEALAVEAQRRTRGI